VEINHNNANLLSQIEENCELVFQELDSLSLYFTTNPQIIIYLKEILRSPTMSYETFHYFDIIKNFITSPANAKPFVNSIYIYFNNPDRKLISSTNGLTALEEFYDHSWYDSYLDRNKKPDTWIEFREINRYSFKSKPVKVLTLYKKIYSPGMQYADGVVILNIDIKYIENMLNKSVIIPQQVVLILDKDKNVIFRSSTDQAEYIDHINFPEILTDEKDFFQVNANNTSYVVSQFSSQRYSWKYVSIVPKYYLYRIPSNLTLITVVLVTVLFLLGLVMAFFTTRNGYDYVKKLLSIINAAEGGQPLPRFPERKEGELEFIVHNIMKTFIEQSYLKLQLSEKQYKLQYMELMALQAQINPHFLFNTLETINWKVIALTNGPNQVNEMIENLSDIVKYSLASYDGTTTLEDEIKYTQNYVAIQRIRYPAKFDVIWQIENDALPCQVIKLLIQPLIENSIYHGIKEKEGKSRIKVKVQLLQADLRIRIIDNGLGVPRERLHSIIARLESDEAVDCKHIGLLNTNKRIKFAYGDSYGLTFQSKQGLGTMTTLLLPAQKG
jgi:two-component system sensor histidine kinase YesM